MNISLNIRNDHNKAEKVSVVARRFSLVTDYTKDNLKLRFVILRQLPIKYTPWVLQSFTSQLTRIDFKSRSPDLSSPMIRLKSSILPNSETVNAKEWQILAVIIKEIVHTMQCWNRFKDFISGSVISYAWIFWCIVLWANGSLIFYFFHLFAFIS